MYNEKVKYMALGFIAGVVFIAGYIFTLQLSARENINDSGAKSAGEPDSASSGFHPDNGRA